MSPARRNIVVIQARLTSTRLPAKALLPICGMASVVLCARRAANTGIPVLVAIPEDASDDGLASILEQERISYGRGPRRDVLKRFALATGHLRDEDVVVRLTADNVFPDGEFIEELLVRYDALGVEYLGTSSPRDGLPHGLSAEACSVRLLREADSAPRSAFDREHVTTWMRDRTNGPLFTVPDSEPIWSRLRCGLDTFDDYRRLLQVFAGVTNPTDIPWRELIARLTTVSNIGLACPVTVRPDRSVCSELTLGTAQFGMPYGIANTGGMPGEEECRAMLQLAIDAGVTTVDTARAYGDAENRIGRLLPAGDRGRLRIVTKLDSLSELAPDAPRSLVRRFVDESVYHSCHALRCDQIDTLLLHRWEHRSCWHGAVWERLGELKSEGIIRRLGVSVYDPADAEAALREPEITHIQAPINILDWRWRDDSFIASVRLRPDVIWHARSVLLQGLLVLPSDRWPDIPGMESEALLNVLDSLSARLGRQDRIDLCFAYVRSLPWVTSLVLGIDNVTQLRSNLQRFQMPALTPSERSEIDSLPHLPMSLLRPGLWKQYQ